MAVILKLTEFPPIPITADSDIYTADSDELTADLEVSGQTIVGYSILITPRDIVEEVELDFYHELKETHTIISGTTINEGNYVRILFTLGDIVEGDSYQLTIKDLSDKIIWRGKAYATNQGDLQNFTLTPKTNNNIIKI